MKQYQAVFNVPENFDPEKVELQATYGVIEDAGLMSIAEEGFVDGEQEITLTPELEQFVKDRTVILKDGSNENDVVRIMFDEGADAADLQMIVKVCEAIYKCPCICLSANMEVFVENADEAIKMLNGMIAKIKTRAAVKDTSGIILPN